MRNRNRKALTDWVLQRDWELAITLTFKKDWTEHRVRTTMRRLWNGLDRQSYQKALKKQGKTFTALLSGRNESNYFKYQWAVPKRTLRAPVSQPSRCWVKVALEVRTGRIISINVLRYLYLNCSELCLYINIQSSY